MVAEAEQLAESTQWKATGDRYRAIVEEWKAAPRIDRAGEQELWQRLSHARATFDKRRRAHFGELDAAAQGGRRGQGGRWSSRRRRSPTPPTGDRPPRAYRRLMTQWKAAGPAPASGRGRALDAVPGRAGPFFTARSAALAERDSDQRANLAAKVAVVEAGRAAGPGRPTSAPRAAPCASFRSGSPRSATCRAATATRVEGRMRAVEQAVREAEQRQWQRSNPEARSRAEAAVDQLTAAIAKLEQQLAAAAGRR